jgi:hypothetical protein
MGLVAGVLLMHAAGFAQSAQFQIPLTIESATGPTHTVELRFGVSGDGPGGSIPDNTYGVDLGSQFGDYEEFSLPPPPPTPIFDVRFKDIPSRVPPPPFPNGLDTGVEEDYRGYTSATQIDSYFVALQGTDVLANQIRVSWPSNLAEFGTSWIMKSQFGLFPEVDMLTMNETTINGALASAGGILIIKTGASAVSVDLVDDLLPATYTLDQNYPNPFNPSTEIRFSLPVSGPVRLTVYNLLGQEIVVLVDEVKPAGNYSARFDGSGLSSGIYMYRLQAEGFTETKSMLMVK